MRVAARPLMLSPCLSTSPTDDAYNVADDYRQQQLPPTMTSYPPVTSPLRSPTASLPGGRAAAGDGLRPGGGGGGGFPPALPPSPPVLSRSRRPWPTSPTESPDEERRRRRGSRTASGLFQQLDSWVRGSAESLVGQVYETEAVGLRTSDRK